MATIVQTTTAATPLRLVTPATLTVSVEPASPRNGLLSPGTPGHTFSDAKIRIGPQWQCVIPPQASGTLQPEDLTERMDERLTIEFTPLTEPPPPQAIESLNSPMAERFERHASGNSGPTTVVETYECDAEGVPELPPGLAVGGMCLRQTPLPPGPTRR